MNFYFKKKSALSFQLSNSNDKKVSLKNVSLMMRGIYRCEVSAEAPSFSTVYGEARMEVIGERIKIFN